MRVLHLIDTLTSGGAERVLATVMAGLRKRGVRQALHLLYGAGPIESLIPRGCPVFRQYNGTSLVTAVRRFVPDVIQSWCSDAAVTAAPVSAALGLPFVHRIATVPSALYGAGACGDVPVRRIRLALMAATRVCALSDTAADDAARYFGIERPAVIYNGYPLVTDGRTAVARKPPSTFLIVAAGRLSAEKGHRQLLSALPGVVSRHPTVRCWIAGEGPLEGALRDQINDLGLDGIVRLLGYRADVPELMRQADLVAFPSLREGFGNALLEGLTAGRPVVASDLPAVRHDVLRDGPGAWLVPPGDAEALERAIDTLVGDSRLRRQLGRQARAVGQRFPVSRTIDGFVALYEDLLDRRCAA